MTYKKKTFFLIAGPKNPWILKRWQIIMRNGKKPKWIENDKKWHNDLFDWFCGLGLSVFVFVVLEVWFKCV